MLKSSKTQHQRILDGKVRLEEVLVSLANVPELPLAGTPQASHNLRIHSIGLLKKKYPSVFQNCSTSNVLVLRLLLRKAWRAPDLRLREWFVFLLRKFYADTVRRRRALQQKESERPVGERRGKKAPRKCHLRQSQKPASRLLRNLMESEQVAAALEGEIPSTNHFEECAVYFQRNLHRARYCPGSGCLAPYFFTVEGRQKYCSAECLLPVQRASKRRWWRANRAKRKTRN